MSIILSVLLFLQVTVEAKINMNITKAEFLVTYAQKAQEGQFPFQAFISSLDGHAQCGGTLIDPVHILTAAHCIKIDDRVYVSAVVATSASIEMGMTQLNGTTKITINSTKMFFHEDYEGRENDIAVIRLETPVQVNQHLKPAKLEYNTYEPGTIALVSGWGSTLTNETPDVSHQESLPNDLMFAEAKIITNEKCQEIYDKVTSEHDWPRVVMGEGRICAESVGKTGGPCVGDSGGPLTVDGEVIGVVESVIAFDEICNKDYPAVYTRVSHFKEWIESKLKEN